MTFHDELNEIRKRAGLPLKEMAAPTRGMKSKVYYHGTPSEEKAMNIAKVGIQHQEVENQTQLTPVEGRVYITPSIAYAQIYALGGNMAGYKGKPQRLIGDHGRYGYVFVIPGSEMKGDIQPDEDVVGQIYAWTYDMITGDGTTDLEWVSVEDKPLVKRLMKDQEFSRTLFYFLDNFVSDTVRRKVLDGEYAYFASLGKKALKTMSDKMKLKLIQYGAHIAHEGAIIPSEMWKLDRMNVGLLRRDGRNFFKVAERVK